MNNIKIYETSKIIGIENIIFGTNIIVDDFCFIYAKAKSYIGSYVHIGCFSSIAGGEAFYMSDFSGLSHGCRIFTGSEDFTGWGFGNPTVPIQYRNITQAPVTLGKYAVIGANAVILPGVNIGEGVAVAANSVVTKDLEPWGIYSGNRRIGNRDKDGVFKNYETFLQNLK